MTPDLFASLMSMPLVPALGRALVHSLWQVTLSAGLTACALFALRRSSSNVRYVVACVGLVLALALPVATAVSLMPESSRANGISGRPAGGVARQAVAPVGREAAATPAAPAQVTAKPSTTGGFDIDFLLPWLVAAWAIGVLLFSFRLLGGWLTVARLAKHGATEPRDQWRELFHRTTERMRFKRVTRLLESTAVAVPTAIGWVRPVVLLPVAALAGLTPRQIEAILAHEIAHLRRYDYLVNLFQSAVEALLFYHPAAWWLSARIRSEREHCCDDVAVEVLGDAKMYAHALTALEERRSGAPRLAAAASGGPLLQRISRLRRLAASPSPRFGWLLPVFMTAFVALAFVSARAVQAGYESARGGSVASGASDQQGDDTQVPVPPAPPMPPIPPTPPPSTQAPPAPPAVPAQAPLPPAAPPQLPEMVAPPVEMPRPMLAPRALPEMVPPVGIRPMLPAQAATPPVTPPPRLNPDLPAQAPLAEQRQAPPAPPAPPTPPPRPAAPARPPRSATPAPPAAVPTPPPPPAAPAAPAPPAQPSLERRSGLLSWLFGDDRSDWHWRSSNNGRTLDVRARGEVVLTDDDRDVQSVSPGGYLTISDRTGLFTVATFEATSSNGKVERKWSGVAEADRKKWLADHLLELVRRTGLAADTRVARILKQSGPDGVLREISRIDSDYVKKLYFRRLLDTATLDSAAATRLIEQAGREMHSAYELASVLMRVPAGLLQDEKSRTAYAQATRSINSDYERRRALTSLLAGGSISPATVAVVLESAKAIRSDYELATVLLALVKATDVARSRDAFLAAADTIQSDYEKRRVLTAYANSSAGSAASPAVIYTSASKMRSSYELATVLIESLRRYPLDAASRKPFFDAVGGLSSDYERSRVLRTLAADDRLDDESLAELMRSASGINSSYERANVLTAVASRHKLQGTAREAYLAAAGSISSRYEQDRALAALTRSEIRR